MKSGTSNYYKFDEWMFYMNYTKIYFKSFNFKNLFKFQKYTIVTFEI